MCGIAGFLETTPTREESGLRELVGRMTETLHHRGPDGSGIWVDPRAGIALGHRRLAIIDLTLAGAQPMASACGRFVITYNGEVYNFLELRQGLESRGYRFRGHSDTEVVLEAIAEWGIESALQRLNGMYAFALWDRESRTLTLARDRAGKKPLYYGWCGRTFLFGSELKALRAHPDFQGDLDSDALGLFIQYSWIPAPFSIFRKVRKLEAGSFLTIAPSGPGASASPRVYWSARDVIEHAEREPFTGSFEEATEALHSLLTQAVRRRMIADVDLGALLSGGVDSSTIVSLMQSTSTARVKTFSIGFHEPKFNEAEHAKAIARHLGTDHTELYVTSNDSLDVIPDLPTIYDEPFADPSQIPTYLISKLVRRTVTVALSGDGGDELFAGYKRYRSCLRYYGNVLRWIPGLVKQSVAGLIEAVDRAGWAVFVLRNGTEPAQGLKLRAPGTNLKRTALRMRASSPVDLLARHHVRCRDATEFVPTAKPVPTLLTDQSRWPVLSDPVLGMMYLNFADYLPEDVLAKVDRASMAVGLEVRCPLLDRNVIEFAWSLPAGMRFGPDGGKPILRSLLSRYVPRELTERPKMGFGVPVGAWIQGPLREWAEDLLDENLLTKHGLLRPDMVRLTWLQHLAGYRNHGSLLWNLLMFQAWLRTHGC
jgi:asparagine synthase (glutamine-hydrolysing)